jgi:hypothetical protein
MSASPNEQGPAGEKYERNEMSWNLHANEQFLVVRLKKASFLSKSRFSAPKTLLLGAILTNFSSVYTLPKRIS